MEERGRGRERERERGKEKKNVQEGKATETKREWRTQGANKRKSGRNRKKETRPIYSFLWMLIPEGDAGETDRRGVAELASSSPR